MFGLSLSRLSTLRAASPRAGHSSRLKGEVKPPSLRCEPSSGWERMKYWVLAPAPLESAPPLSQLPKVRKDFLACLEGTTGTASEKLTIKIERARSLRELWHLRASLFGLLACSLSQSEAERRLHLLDHHFSGTGHPRSALQ
ncbi:MAG: hypothetical protein ACOVOG_05095 [Rubrivivax sp.]|nr:hypothetical protein [Rubrivivax sp.]